MYSNKTIIRYGDESRKTVVCNTMEKDKDTGITHQLYFPTKYSDDITTEFGYGFVQSGLPGLDGSPVICICADKPEELIRTGICDILMRLVSLVLIKVRKYEGLNDEDKPLYQDESQHITATLQLIVDYYKTVDREFILSTHDIENVPNKIFQYAMLIKGWDFGTDNARSQNFILPDQKDKVDPHRKWYSTFIVDVPDKVRISCGRPLDKEASEIIDEFMIKIEYPKNKYDVWEILSVVSQIINNYINKEYEDEYEQLVANIVLTTLYNQIYIFK